MSAAMKAACLVATVALLFSGAGAQFVSVGPGGTSFRTDACRDLPLALYNSWEAVEAGADLCCGGSAGLGAQFAAARAANLNAVRFFAFATLDGEALQTAPGQYDSALLTGLDRAVAAAGRNGLKVILALANNWDTAANGSDTKSFYTNHSTTAHAPDDFWTDAGAINAYLAHVRTLTSRVNSVSGVAYNADPTIMAWDLINEGRCETSTCNATAIQSWLARVAPVVKSYVPNQLLTVGQEGFWQADNCASDTTNPVPNSDGWPLKTGQDFLANHAFSSIDFTSTHLTPVNWARLDNVFGTAWLNGHAKQSGLIGKPLLVELFATQVGVNNFTAQNASDYYKLVYAIVEASINTGGPIRGVGFSLWDAVTTSPNAPGLDRTTLVSSTSPQWTQTIVPYAGRVTARCPAQGPAVAPSRAAAAPTAASTRRRLQQTGGPPNTLTTPQAAGQGPAGAPVDAAAINRSVPPQYCANDTTLHAAPSLAPSVAAAVGPVARGPAGF